ncbi:hypothetical protein O6H91_11G041100 [Diphasiastrum complanatum]|uniref:Uncharacterized protein n=2 Tax=Diphasiastrum complanatum TaxID=34168 RepID=A0ACC2C893_DIPCM|nr:hypothetical protein O6H91_11G041000 [Diphasiastrum complanatum]KAJ7538273.1 hypothetical protein O6H91_11G041100 [Diphasiastrum complanatum]
MDDASSGLSPLTLHGASMPHLRCQETELVDSDSLPLYLGLANRFLLALLFSASYHLISRWSKKVRTSRTLHIVNLKEIFTVISQLASFIYSTGFEFVQNFICRKLDIQFVIHKRSKYKSKSTLDAGRVVPASKAHFGGKPLEDACDENLAHAIGNGDISPYGLEAHIGDCTTAARVRKRYVELKTGRSLEDLPLMGMDYKSLQGQCCEMVIGYVQIPVGIAGPLLLDGNDYLLPMATTEGCLVASTNRGCKAILQSGGATSVLLRDGMTRAPVVRFPNVKRAADLKWYMENPSNFDDIADVFNSTSRFARLQNLHCALAGRNVYMRFRCSTGDAMGMNMVSKGVQNVLNYLQDMFQDMEIVSMSGNFCADKKPTAVNWTEGRGKSVVCEAVISGDVISKTLKTSVSGLVELNTIKNLAGSALAGALGGFNAHASNVVSAIFIATGQDPAQNVESSQCMTLMESINNGKDLHISVTMPSIEVGTVGGGTQLASQAACLNILGIGGANVDSPGKNAQTLARIIAGAVLAGELSLMSALATGQLVESHMKYNRSINRFQE